MARCRRCPGGAPAPRGAVAPRVRAARLDGLVGLPHADLYYGMLDEHCGRADSVLSALSRAEALELAQRSGAVRCLGVPAGVEFGIDLRSHHEAVAWQ